MLVLCGCYNKKDPDEVGLGWLTNIKNIYFVQSDDHADTDSQLPLSFGYELLK